MNLIVIGENKPDCLDVLLKFMPKEVAEQCDFMFWYDDRNFNNIGKIITKRLFAKHSSLRNSRMKITPASEIITTTCNELDINPSNILNQYPLIVKLYALRFFSRLNIPDLDYILFCDDDVVLFRDVAPLFDDARRTKCCYYQTERIYGKFDHSRMSLYELAMFNEIFETSLTPEQYNVHLLNSGTLIWKTDYLDIDTYIQRLSKSKKWKWFWFNKMSNRSRVFFMEERFTNFLYHMRDVKRFNAKDVEFTNTFTFTKRKQNVPIALHYAHGDKDMPKVLTWLNHLQIDDSKLVCSLDKNQFVSMLHKAPQVTKNPTKVFRRQ